MSINSRGQNRRLHSCSTQPTDNMANSRILVLALVVLCYTQVSTAGLVKRDTGSTASDLQEALTNLGNVFSQGWYNLTQAVGQHIPTTEEVHNNTLNLARTLGTYAGQLQNEAASLTGDFKHLTENASSQFTQLKTNLENIDASKTAEEVKQQVQQNVNAFAEEARKFLNSNDHSEGTQSVINLVNQAVHRVNEISSEFTKGAQSSTTQH